ncbi:23S rRNA (guanosine(2251)-2'-O)-methyltransferase RlmB [Cryptosporangium phraense]|uniref:23S rRNA (Guanosine(2251)-2'-O)-methyltransferase RlmB n=1 Tax=Cryptosporangium phraense TaxID=2593070 RepID=A0A545AP83_9ACTN|nr:23S rRNA (guanosine(2251)-2'-O)-methyltransferase RlmB [Cryptosporangium phraense]TQS43139.1 23S rRNA (guanosine(2251)-2'-O)-methyltransferase RlmB [Cryptosporangium phraense]
MPGNSPRPNRRKAGTKKGAVVGSGGQRRKGLEGKGPTPKAVDRFKHVAARKAAAARKANPPKNGDRPRTAAGRRAQGTREGAELLVGRNPVVEALRAEIPASALFIAQGVDVDERINEAVQTAGDRGLSILEVSRTELDRMTGGVLHQGIGLKVPPYSYADLPDVLSSASGTPLLVALDGVTDPRNLGAVVRSAAAFGASGVILPERRAAGMTATAWRTSAGAAARVPVARVTNLTRTLRSLQDQGFTVLGLDADGDVDSDSLDVGTDPVVIVVGSEGRGLSRLVGEACDQLVSIPMTSDTESLNASVAAAVLLADVARQRRQAAHD